MAHSHLATAFTFAFLMYLASVGFNDINFVTVNTNANVQCERAFREYLTTALNLSLVIKFLFLAF